jgi:hypothetical protein
MKQKNVTFFSLNDRAKFNMICCNFTSIHGLTGPVGQPFASRVGVSGLHPRDAPNLTMEPGLSC